MPNVYVRFALYIVLFSAIVSIGTSLINYNVQYRDLDRNILEESKGLADLLSARLGFDVRHIERDIFAIINSPLFREYLRNRDRDSSRHVMDLLLSHSDANEGYFQIRFLDAAGMEQIRLDKDRITLESHALPQSALQDKSGRYYFRETMAVAAGQTWRSKLDLNVEHGEIEQPIRPTLRVAAPVFQDGAARGMLIINVDMSNSLELMTHDADFRAYLVDGDGYFLKHANDALSWSRYLNTGARVQTTWPDVADRLFADAPVHAGDLHSFPLEQHFRNGENTHLVLEAQAGYIAALKRHNLKVAAYLALMILAIAIPVGLLLAVWPARVQRALREALDQNARQLSIIDRYVPTFSARRDGTITEISRALCQLSGHDKTEVIGHSLMEFVDQAGSKEFITDAWPNLGSWLVWQGEIQGRCKNGDAIWLESTVLPEYKDGRAAGISVVSIDVTDKKRIARLSEEDHLTGLYNRVRLDQVLIAETARVQRYGTRFSGILLDADHFKAVNDEFGHLVGDMVLKSIAELLRTHVRSTDVVGRWGGEEFMILCLETPLAGARELAENLRAEIAAHQFERIPSQTASFGVSEFTAGETLEAFVKRMDDALYAAKAGGRNRVVAG